MVFEIFLVIIDGHFLDWQPAVFRLTHVSDQTDIVFMQMPEDRVKFRIIDHDQIPILISEFHANIFPHFYRNCTVLKCAIQVSDGSFLPPGFIPSLHFKSRSKCNVAWIGIQMPGCNFQLIFKRRKIRIINIEGKKSKIILNSLFNKSGIFRIDVDVSVNLSDAHEIIHRKIVFSTTRKNNPNGQKYDYENIISVYFFCHFPDSSALSINNKYF